MKYIKNPVIIEASQWSGGLTSIKAIQAMYPLLRVTRLYNNGETVYGLEIDSNGNSVPLNAGDYIIKHLHYFEVSSAHNMQKNYKQYTEE